MRPALARSSAHDVTWPLAHYLGRRPDRTPAPTASADIAGLDDAHRRRPVCTSDVLVKPRPGAGRRPAVVREGLDEAASPTLPGRLRSPTEGMPSGERNKFGLKSEALIRRFTFGFMSPALATLPVVADLFGLGQAKWYGKLDTACRRSFGDLLDTAGHIEYRQDLDSSLAAGLARVLAGYRDVETDSDDRSAVHCSDDASDLTFVDLRVGRCAARVLGIELGGGPSDFRKRLFDEFLKGNHLLATPTPCCPGGSL